MARSQTLNCAAPAREVEILHRAAYANNKPRKLKKDCRPWMKLLSPLSIFSLPTVAGHENIPLEVHSGKHSSFFNHALRVTMTQLSSLFLFSSHHPFLIVPGPPEWATLDVVGSNTLKTTFAPPLWNGGSPVSSYLVNSFFALLLIFHNCKSLLAEYTYRLTFHPFRRILLRRLNGTRKLASLRCNALLRL